MTAGWTQGGGAYVWVPHKERPLGVAIMAVLIGIIAFLFVLLGLLLIVAAAFLAVADSVTAHFGLHIITGSLLVVGVLVLILGIVLLAVAMGLWGLRMWALVLCLLVFGVLFIADILSLDPFLILWGLLIVYLLSIRRHFV